METVTVDILRETDDGIQVNDGDNDVWLPKSQIFYVGEPGDKMVEIELPLWLAEKSGLV
jgi:hypothetical protein